ncbi:MAG: 1-acyl-sn-glycerol-3-phosphate acyltransferase [Prevotella sp.]|nr:1-acyl-sn-glycerol-3-phosphate acyltransferase [Prevotella sp.]MCD8289143.1 1-acyl-sn-glycerol-3-phosphate acyltransferase [Prevotella sp.]MCD8306513.1 1-acyl-sn-glycerol-3-phosphate acyltransferase [Prevotella sp.]
MKILYRIYQIIILLPVGIVATILTATITIIGCALGGNRVWGYYPGKWWSVLVVRLALLPVSIEGREKLQKGQSYVFCSNHQGAFDIFLIYGFLCRNFKWMMKESLRKIPFVGRACAAAGFIFVDRGRPAKMKHVYEVARGTLKDGMSLLVFPEGHRTLTGKVGPYKRGAFTLADELQLPVVPLTINGSFEVLPNSGRLHFLVRHRLRLTIHEPILPVSRGPENLQRMEELSRLATISALDEQYK